MKTKAQKQEEIKKGEEYLKNSTAVLFVDFAKVQTKDLRNLRSELKASGNPMFIIKKRLLGVMLKGKEGLDMGQFKTSVATVFASDIESATASIYKFFNALKNEKKVEDLKILGGYDLNASRAMTKAEVTAIGQLPPREVLLGQLLGMIAAPIRSFLYVLDQKAKQGEKVAS